MARKSTTEAQTDDARQVIRQFGWHLAGTLAGGARGTKRGDKAASESPGR